MWSIGSASPEAASVSVGSAGAQGKEGSVALLTSYKLMGGSPQMGPKP